MRIQYKRPVVGRRELICQGDEASVSRIRSRTRYDGIVERTQPFDDSKGFEFEISAGALRSKYAASQMPYHLLRACTLALARTMHPENFIHVSELRLFKSGSRHLSAVYSDFVPDKDGARLRVCGYRKNFRFYDRDEGERFRARCDMNEHMINPFLGRAIGKVLGSGLEVPHPEANYCTQFGGAPVFFEVCAVHLAPALGYAMCLDPGRSEQALRQISLLYSLMLKINAARTKADCPGARLFMQEPLRRLFNTCHKILSADPPFPFVFERGAEVLKSDPDLLRIRAGDLLDHGLPHEIGPHILDFLEGRGGRFSAFLRSTERPSAKGSRIAFDY